MGNIKKWFNNRGRIQKWCSRVIDYLGYPLIMVLFLKTIVSVDDGDGDAIDRIILSQKNEKRYDCSYKAIGV